MRPRPGVPQSWYTYTMPVLTVDSLHAELGPKWVRIAKLLPGGRTSGAVSSRVKRVCLVAEAKGR